MNHLKFIGKVLLAILLGIIILFVIVAVFWISIGGG